MPETPADRMSLYVAAVRRHWRLALGIVAVALMSGLLVATLAPRSYEATAKVLIGQRAQVDALLGATDYTPDPERDVNTNLALITLEPVAESVNRRLDLGLSAGALTSKVKTEIDGNSNLVSITVRDSSPGRAARIANAFAESYRDFRARSARASLDDAVASARRRAALLAPGAERDALDQELRQLQAAAAFQTGGVQIVRRAKAASAAAGGGTLPTAIISGFLGTVLAAAAIVLLARTDKRVRSEADIEAAAGRPVLATVPVSTGGGDSVDGRDASATLALSLTLRGLRSRAGASERLNGRSARVLLVTSPGPGEGTTEVAVGLARALSDLGKTVIAIEADLRAPAVGDLLGLGPAPGLAGILDGATTLDDELVEIAWTPGGAGRAWVVPAGSSVGLPQPLLAGRRMVMLLAEARAKATVVILVGPPAAGVGDSLALAQLADAVVLVAGIDRTRREEVGRVVRELDELGRPLAGTVATTGRPGARCAPSRPGGRRRPVPASPGRADAATGTSNGSSDTSPTLPEVTVR